jgi:hypothetical protein
VDRPEVALAGPEHDGYDVHAHLVNQARGKHLATDVATRSGRPSSAVRVVAAMTLLVGGPAEAFGVDARRWRPMSGASPT